MNQRALVTIEVQRGEHTFSFYMPLGAQWSDAFSAAQEIFSGLEAHIKKLEEKAKEEVKEPVEVVAEVL